MTKFMISFCITLLVMYGYRLYKSFRIKDVPVHSEVEPDRTAVSDLANLHYIACSIFENSQKPLINAIENYLKLDLSNIYDVELPYFNNRERLAANLTPFIKEALSDLTAIKSTDARAYLERHSERLTEELEQSITNYQEGIRKFLDSPFSDDKRESKKQLREKHLKQDKLFFLAVPFLYTLATFVFKLALVPASVLITVLIIGGYIEYKHAVQLHKRLIYVESNVLSDLLNLNGILITKAENLPENSSETELLEEINTQISKWIYVTNIDKLTDNYEVFESFKTTSPNIQDMIRKLSIIVCSSLTNRTDEFNKVGTELATTLKKHYPTLKQKIDAK